jgi:hypothetical protein
MNLLDAVYWVWNVHSKAELLHAVELEPEWGVWHRADDEFCSSRFVMRSVVGVRQGKNACSEKEAADCFCFECNQATASPSNLFKLKIGINFS